MIIRIDDVRCVRMFKAIPSYFDKVLERNTLESDVYTVVIEYYNGIQLVNTQKDFRTEQDAYQEFIKIYTQLNNHKYYKPI